MKIESISFEETKDRVRDVGAPSASVGWLAALMWTMGRWLRGRGRADDRAMLAGLRSSVDEHADAKYLRYEKPGGRTFGNKRVGEPSDSFVHVANSELPVADDLGLVWDLWRSEDGNRHHRLILGRDFCPSAEKMYLFLAVELLRLGANPRRVSPALRTAESLVKALELDEAIDVPLSFDGDVRRTRKRLRRFGKGQFIAALDSRGPWPGIGRAYDFRARLLERQGAAVYVPLT